MAFTWQNKSYEFDSELCYDTSNLIRLPDGTLLSMNSWLEISPPKPMGLYEAGPHELVRGEPIPAKEI